MTAPQPATPGSDSVRAQIAEVLRAAALHAESIPCDMTCQDVAACPSCSQPVTVFGTQNDVVTAVYADVEGTADVLVPLVDSLRAEAKAEALEEAAVWLADPGSNGAPEIASNGSQCSLAPLTWMVRSLRDRAAAYRTNPSSEETHRG